MAVVGVEVPGNYLGAVCNLLDTEVGCCIPEYIGERDSFRCVKADVEILYNYSGLATDKQAEAGLGRNVRSGKRGHWRVGLQLWMAASG